MLDRINSGNDVKHTLCYNEDKVTHETATKLGEFNLPLSETPYSITDLIRIFEARMALNRRSKKTMFHISLGFHKDDVLDDEKLKSIAASYMQGIKMDKQPYIIYRHFDAPHSHIHLVTANINPEGKRLNQFWAGKSTTRNARRNVERQFGLIKGEGKIKTKSENNEKNNVRRAQYLEKTSSEKIQEVLDNVLFKYKYSNLLELNQVLKTYNIKADRGSEKSICYQKNGLRYYIIDDNGKNKICP